MEIVEVKSNEDLDSQLVKNEKTWCVIYKRGSKQSDCAIDYLKNSISKLENIQLLMVDVSKTRDIHGQYNITSAPSLLEFEGKNLKNVIKGCQSQDYYTNLFEESLFRTEIKKEGKPQKRVTVYTTPSCSWCTTLKTHLRKHRIQYNEIDVSTNQSAAQAMVQKSGQQGVPQTEINGEMIIGFDKNRINKLLNITN